MRSFESLGPQPYSPLPRVHAWFCLPVPEAHGGMRKGMGFAGMYEGHGIWMPGCALRKQYDLGLPYKLVSFIFF